MHYFPGIFGIINDYSCETQNGQFPRGITPGSPEFSIALEIILIFLILIGINFLLQLIIHLPLIFLSKPQTVDNPLQNNSHKLRQPLPIAIIHNQIQQQTQPSSFYLIDQIYLLFFDIDGLIARVYLLEILLVADLFVDD